jgi:signal transduction histidine kinase/ligand-binding sensor domain-containing protein
LNVAYPVQRHLWLSVLGLFLCLSSNPARSATPWFARVWQVDDGLPGDNVAGVAQTRDGYLWVATQSGLARFDGVRIQSIRVPLGRPRPIIRALLLDVNQRLWLAEEGGVVVWFSPGESRMLTVTNGLARSQPLEIVQTGDKAVWISYVNGSVARVVGERAVTFGEAEGLPSSGVCSLASDAQGQLWFAKAGQVGVFRQERFVTLLNLGERYIEVQKAGGNRIWICAGDKLLSYEPNTAPVQVGRITAGAALVRPTALFEDRSGGVWVGTSAGGLSHYDGTNIARVGTSHARIRTIAEDREGNIWVGTDGGGLNRLRPQVAELQGKEAGLPFDTVRSVCEAATGALWVVTQNGEVAVRENGEWRTISSSQSWPGGQATCVTCDGEGVVWVGTYSRGLYRWQNGQFSVLRRTDGLAGLSIRSLLADSKRNLWIAFSALNTLQRLRDGRFESYPLPKGSRAVRAITEDAAGNIWMANLDAQLLRVDGGGVSDETPRRGDGRPIRCLAGTSDGSLWIGYSAAGVGRLKGGRFALIGKAQGLQDDSICSLMADERGWIWFGSDHGIFCVNQQDLANVAEGKAAAVQSIGYAKDHGLPSVQGYYGYSPGAARTRDGRILIPTHAGLAIMYPDRVQTNRVRPPVLIESVSVDNQVVQTGPSYLTLVLPPHHRKLEVAFTAPSFIEPEKVRFRYRLSGLEQDWVEAGNGRSALYPRLPAGKYQFSVMAGNYAGVWNEAGAYFTLEVRPFLWQTWWFRAVVGALLAAAVFAAGRYVSFRMLQRRVRRLEQENALQTERARIAQDIHDDLGARMTQISLLSELTRHVLPEPQKAGDLVAQIATMSRQGIKSLDEIVWAVNPRNDTLPDLLDYAGQYAVDFLQAAGIRCRVDFPATPPPRDIPAPVRHGLFLAIKEALHNIVKHARATEVWLRVSVSDHSLRWEIEDNGRGFDQRPNDALADGVRNMQQRLTGLGGTCSVASRAGAGTRIDFEVPWQKA